jgi:hypothetical protein
MKLEIIKITVVNTGGADTIYLVTTLPNPIWPFEGNSVLKMESAQSYTEKFLADNFPGMEYKYIKS